MLSTTTGKKWWVSLFRIFLKITTKKIQKKFSRLPHVVKTTRRSSHWNCSRFFSRWKFTFLPKLAQHQNMEKGVLSLQDSFKWFLSNQISVLTHFMPLISFDTPWKHQKTRGFLILSGGIKRDQWHEMG